MGITVRLKEFFAKRNRLLLFVAIIIVVALYFLLYHSKPNLLQLEKNFEHCREDMLINPSATNAAKMLDCAISMEQPELVLEVLQDIIYPHLGIKGVEAEFFRGSYWYLATPELRVDDVLWLAAEERRLPRDAKFNEVLAEYYLTLSGSDAVRCGNGLFVRWQLDSRARCLYVSCLKRFLGGVGLPIYPTDSFSGIRYFDDFSYQFVDAPEFAGVAPWLQLWLSCWRDSDADIPKALADLEAVPDPLDLRPRIWASLVLKDLGPNWQSSFGVNLMAELPKFSPFFEGREALFLYEQRDPLSPDHAFLLLDHCGDKLDSAKIVRLLLRAGGVEEKELERRVLTTGLYKPGPPAVLELLARLAPFIDEYYYFRLQVILGADCDERFTLEKTLVFQDIELYEQEFSFSPLLPMALIGTNGIRLVDMLTMEETTFPETYGIWSLKGDFFVLLQPGTKSSVVRVMSAAGQEIERYSFPFALYDEYISCYWQRPWELVIYSFKGDSQNAYSLNMRTKTISPIGENAYLGRFSIVPGTDYYFSDGEGTKGKLINWAGDAVGTVNRLCSEGCRCGGAEFSVRGIELLFDGKLVRQWEESDYLHIDWVAAVEGEEQLYCLVYDDIHTWGQVLVINREGRVVSTLNPRALYDEATSVMVKRDGFMREVSSGWLEPGAVFWADGDIFPLFLTNCYLVGLHKIEDRYIAMFWFEDGELWIMNYKSDRQQ